MRIFRKYFEANFSKNFENQARLYILTQQHSCLKLTHLDLCIQLWYSKFHFGQP
jgi:hypothetical protein